MFEHISTIKELLSITTEYYGEKPVFSYMEDGKINYITYSEFSKNVTAVAKSLILKGITNSKVSIASENSYYCLVWSYAIVLSGNVLVMLDNMATTQEKSYMVTHSDTFCLVYSSLNKEICDYITDHNKSVIHTICIETDTKAYLNCDAEVILPDTDGSELSYLFYTSGTTGKPKGVMQSQINLLRTSLYTSYSLEIKDTIYLMLPIHHILPFANQILLSMYSGANIFISAGLKHLLVEMQQVRPYCVFIVPAVLTYFDKIVEDIVQKQSTMNNFDYLMARKQAFRQLFGGQLRIIVCGGGPLNIDVAKRMQEVGVLVLNGYGLTETAGSITVNPNDDNRLGSVGRINANSEAKVKDDELLFKSAYLFMGYYKDPESTAQAFDGEWFLTGDLGYMEDNYVYLSGRKKNLIVLPNGKNISPEELEFEFMKMEEINEIVICEQNGKLTAKIYTDCEEGIIRKKISDLNKKLASYKQIESVVFYKDEFPKTASKKIKRGEI